MFAKKWEKCLFFLFFKILCRLQTAYCLCSFALWVTYFLFFCIDWVQIFSKITLRVFIWFSWLPPQTSNFYKLAEFFRINLSSSQEGFWKFTIFWFGVQQNLPKPQNSFLKWLFKVLYFKELFFSKLYNFFLSPILTVIP